MVGCPGTWVHMSGKKGSSSKAWAITLLQCRGNTACALPETFESTVPSRERQRVRDKRAQSVWPVCYFRAQDSRIVESGRSLTE